MNEDDDEKSNRIMIFTGSSIIMKIEWQTAFCCGKNLLDEQTPNRKLISIHRKNKIDGLKLSDWMPMCTKNMYMYMLYTLNERTMVHACGGASRVCVCVHVCYKYFSFITINYGIASVCNFQGKQKSANIYIFRRSHANIWCNPRVSHIFIYVLRFWLRRILYFKRKLITCGCYFNSRLFTLSKHFNCASSRCLLFWKFCHIGFLLYFEPLSAAKYMYIDLTVMKPYNEHSTHTNKMQTHAHISYTNII